MQKHLLIGILAMATVVVASNILVQFLVQGSWMGPWIPFGIGEFLTFGAFSYPFAFLVTDSMNRVYGLAQARKVVFAGFVVGIICSLIGTQIMGEFGPWVTLRIAIGSGTAFLVAQMFNTVVFDGIQKQSHEREWWKPPTVSSLIGSVVDTFLFFSIAFSDTLSFIDPSDDVSWAGEILPVLGWGPESPLWVSLAFADWLVKMFMIPVALVIYGVIVSIMKPITRYQNQG